MSQEFEFHWSTFKMIQCMKFMKFVECIWSKTDEFMGNLGPNRIEHEEGIVDSISFYQH